MHWVVDTCLVRERGYESLLSALERQGVEHTIVRKPPFADYLVDEDKNPITLDVGHDVFVTGTLSMKGVAEKHDWNPGYVDAPPQDELIRNWGDHLLNADCQIARFEDIVVPDYHFFARPTEDTKSFSGTVFSPQEFIDFRKRVMNIETSEATLTADDMVLIARPKNIYAEYRLFVIGGRIATGSRYKMGQRVHAATDLDEAMLKYAEERIAEYCPRRALCLDIAHIDDDENPYRIIETNAISSAGFYACDMNKFVGAINDEFFPQSV